MKPYNLPRFLLPCMLVNMALTVSAAPLSINFQPKDQSVILYQQAAFGVIASGTAPLAYQWRKDGVPIVGATNDQIVLAQAQFFDAGRYSVIISNSENSVTSADTDLTVNAPKGGDLDCSFACGSWINGSVHSMAVQPDGKVLIAGDFSTVHGAARSGIARLNADGTTDYTFISGVSGANGVVAVQHDGKVLIGGNSGIARLNADGTPDSGFQNGLSGGNGVSSIVVQGDGKVLIGAGFTYVNGVSRNNIARLNADGSLDSGFLNGLSGVNGRPFDSLGSPGVNSVEVQSDGKVLIGGYFAMVNGVSRINIARLNADGTLDGGFLNGLSGASSPGVYAEIYSVAVQSDGKVIIGGQFTVVNGVSRTNMARLDADGALDTSFDPVAGGWPIAIQSDGKILAWPFRLNADGSRDSGFQNELAELDGYGSSVAVQSDGKLLIGGYYSHGIARLNADGSRDNRFQNGLAELDGNVSSVAGQNDGKVLIVGQFTAVNHESRNNIARLNADGTMDNGFQAEVSGTYSAVRSVVLQSDAKVLIAGYFNTVNGVSRTNIARLNTDGTLDSGFEAEVSETDSVPSSLALQSDGKVLVAFVPTVVNGMRNPTRLARLNTDGSLDSGFQAEVSGTDSRVRSVVVQSDGKVLIGGWFDEANGVSGLENIARFNTDGTLDNGFQGLASANGAVESVALQTDGKVLIGGSFNVVNGVSRNGIARLNADGSLDSGFQKGLSGDPGLTGLVFSVAVQGDGKVLIGGGFNAVNDASRNSIARLNADGTVDSSFQNGMSGIPFIACGFDYCQFVSAVALQTDGKVLVGGRFRTVNGVPAAGVARLWGSADIPPQIKRINRNGTDVNLAWSALPNRKYRVQYKDTLSANNWTDLAGDVSANGATASKTDAIPGGASQRYYRVVLLP
jgi:uncharacterized delta-60 repeat protein